MQGCWTEGLGSSLAAGLPQLLVGGPLCGADQNMGTGFQQCELEGQKESKKGQARWDPGSFCILIPEMTSHHLCHNLSARSNQSSPHSGGGLSTGVRARRWQPLGALLEAADHAWGRPRWRHPAGAWTCEFQALGRYLGLEIQIWGFVAFYEQEVKSWD